MRVAIFLLISVFFIFLNATELSFEKNVTELSKRSISEDFFSAVSFSVWKGGKRISSINEGFVNSKTPGTSVTDKTLFDLASLTKPIVIVSLFFYLEKQKLIDRNWKISRFLPEIKKEITLFNMLTHKSSLPAYADFFKFPSGESNDLRKKQIVEYIAGIEKSYPGQYSDINYILLGFIIEQITKKDLDTSFKEFLKKEFPFKNSFSYLPLKNGIKASKIAATSFSPPRQKVTQGEVEDENAAYLGGISGHAGLFGTADDVSQFFSLMLKNPYYKKNIKNQTGFDKKDCEDSNYGSIADSTCSGHLGWTGTAFLICPEDNVVITILTNRTHSSKYSTTDMTNIKKFRQTVFDAVLSEIIKK